jgi:hypothetical protein
MSDDDAFFDQVLAYAEPGRLPPDAKTPTAQWREWWRRRWIDCGAGSASRLARTQGFVATIGQLGWKRHDVRRELRHRTWWSPTRGTLSPVDPADDDRFVEARRRHALVTAAAVLTHRRHVAAGRSLLIMHGLPTLDVPSAPELVRFDGGTTGRRPHAHVRSMPPTRVRPGSWYGVPTGSLSTALVDLARADRREGLIAVDAALHERMATRREIDDAVAEGASLPGIRRARELLALASARAESPLESLTRLALHDDGFPEPELQVWIEIPGGFRYRVDLLFRKQRLIVEADGLVKYSDREHQRERLREARLRRAGYRVERVVWEDVVTYWPQTSRRLRAELRG